MHTIKYVFKLLARTLSSLYFLCFLNGFLIASLFYFKTEANYENELFDVIQKSINKKIDANDNKDSVLIKIMQTCNTVLGNRAQVFNNSAQALEGFKTDFLHPATVDLMTANGACGSYALVLARILENYHFPIRIDQMKANGNYGGHNIIEVNIDGKWIVLDPLFNLYFVRPNAGGLASFDDVKNDWGYYSKRLPPGYDTTYRYEDVRYTNWNKVPIVLPAIKKTLDLLLGKKRADTISLRVHFLRMYDLFFDITLFLFILTLLVTVQKIVRRNIFSNAAEPLKGQSIKEPIQSRSQRAALKERLQS